ncbi:hypothetical protein GCM10011325_25300 [Dyadobacter sediminis]|nr:hypothetical protein GCM10011325_25300 [Dyadobacter sediminis]
MAQNVLVPALHTSSDSLIMYLDNQQDEFNGVNKLGSRFSYSFVVEKDSAVLALVSESDSISMILRPHVNTSFQIIRESGKDTVTCTFTVQKLVKPATFTDQYKAENKDKIIIEIPEVYELVNIIFALTAYGKTNAIYKDTDYYKTVIGHFQQYNRDPVVQVMDSLLKLSPGFFYQHLKMDSYAFGFSENQIRNTGVYDRIASGERNELQPYVPMLQTFSEKAGYRAFYKKHLDYYSGLIKDYRNYIKADNMKSWLEKEFPGTKYSAVKVIFSPLVGWNQSASFFNDNHFSEAQAHVNFPFLNSQDLKQSRDIRQGLRMMIAFTELNHAYLNPEAEKHSQTIHAAFNDLSRWITAGKPSAGYNNSLVCFEEYMNYGLVTLYYSDILNKEAFEIMSAHIENNMVNSRGFVRFREFNQELLRLYKNKSSGQTVADLYTDMIKWASR